MRIGINGRFGTAPRTGVQRFAWEVSKRLVERADAVLLLPRTGWVTGEPRRKAQAVTYGQLNGHLWEQIELPRQARRAQCDVTLHLANTGPSWSRANVLMVHDVTPLTHPEWYGARFRTWYRIAMARAARNAARVLTGSEWSRSEIVRTVRIPAERISVVGQGVAPFDAPAQPGIVEEVLSRFGIEPGYVLAMGGMNPRKNVRFLIDIMSQWSEKRGDVPRLVVAGLALPGVHPTSGRERAPRPAPRTQPTQLGYVSDEELHALYTAASVFCFPSLAEGFGRPPLEAMGCGTPVISADYGAAGDVLGDAAIRVPLEPDQWIGALERITSDSAERQRRIELGRVRTAQFSWDQAADAVLAACEAAADRSRPKAQGVQRIAHRGVADRVAVVHDWLTGMRGGEKVLEALIDEYPDCEIFTLIHVPGAVSAKIDARPIHASILSHLPGVKWYYRYLLPLFPWAIERFDLTGFDKVISISHCVAKGVRPSATAHHVCYCLTPMRYVWEQYEAYFGKGRASWPVRMMMRLLRPRLKRWDARSAVRVDRFVAISKYVKTRIARSYGRDAHVQYPPVDTERFRSSARGPDEREDFFLTVSALVPYKRVDVLIDAFNQLEYPLIVVGEGSEFSALRRMAASNIQLLGRVPDERVADLMGRCRAFVYAAEEDFGIVLAEAQDAGAPLIAYGRGGVLEVVALVNGKRRTRSVLFDEQSAEALVDAIRRFDEE